MSQRQPRQQPMMFIPQERSVEIPNPIIDSSFPSVLVYGTLGSIVSIATVWLVSVMVYAPASAPVLGASERIMSIVTERISPPTGVKKRLRGPASTRTTLWHL